jgi:hypothetical protein
VTVLDTPRVDTIILDETMLEETACCKFDRNPAAWLAKCRYCPKTVLWCDYHHERVTQVDTTPGVSWQCRGCAAYGTHWRDISYAVQI